MTTQGLALTDLVKLFYTRHRVLRGTMPDSIVDNSMYLVKYASALRATYQIRLLAVRAVAEGTKLVIIVPPHCKLQRALEDDEPGARFPVLMLHSDCDGEWSPDEAAHLSLELDQIESAFADLPPRPLESGWKLDVAKSLGLRPANLGECFFDVDGEPLLARLKALCKISVERSLPILFQ